MDFHFFDSRPTGKILARIIGDINALKDVLSNSVTTLIPDFITICAVVCIMFAKNPILAAAALSSIPLLIIGIWFIQSRSHVRWQIHKKKSSNLNAFVHEDLSGIRIIQSFHAKMFVINFSKYTKIFCIYNTPPTVICQTAHFPLIFRQFTTSYIIQFWSIALQQ